MYICVHINTCILLVTMANLRNRSRSRSRSPRHDLEPLVQFRFVQPSEDILGRLFQALPAAVLAPQVRWLVQQTPEWKGWYRDAYRFGPLLEEMYAKNVEIAEAELLFRDANGHVIDVQWYRHQMKLGDDVMTQTRYTDEHRKHVTYTRNLVRVIIQKSRAAAAEIAR